MSPLPDVFDVFIVGGARTPMTGFVGALKDVSALELGAIAARGAFDKTGIKPASRRTGLSPPGTPAASSTEARRQSWRRSGRAEL